MTEGLNPSDEIIVSFVDGELNSHEAAAIESALVENRDLQLKVDNYRKSRVILNNAFSVDGAITPDHVLSRIDGIVKAAKKSQKTSLFQLSKMLPFLERAYSHLRLQYALPAAVTFSMGILISPLINPPNENTSTTDFQTAPLSQIALRGGGSDLLQEDRNEISTSASRVDDIQQYLNTRAIQNGAVIYSGGVLKANEEFSIILSSPLNGSATLSELTDSKSTDDASITEKGAITVDVSQGRYVNFPVMTVDEQSLLTLIISLKNQDIEISQTIVFEVQN